MRVIQTIIFFIFGSLLLCHAQRDNALPVLEPYYTNHFYQNNASYANKCFDDALIDQKGRLWLRTCHIHTVINAIGLLQFDGYQFIPHDLKNDEKLVSDITLLVDVSSSGQLFGTVGQTSHLFFTDPDNLETQFISLASFPNRIVKNIVETRPDQFLITFVTQDLRKMGMLSLQNGILKEVWIIDRPPDSRIPAPFEMPLIDTPGETWCMGFSLPLYRYDKATDKLIVYDITRFNNLTEGEFPNPILNQKTTLVKNSREDFYLHLPQYYGDKLFQFDRKIDRFNSIMDQFPANWKAKGIFQDQTGNICFLFQDKNETYQAILQDTLGNRFDYSRVVQNQSEIKKLIAQDFFRQVFVVGLNGLFNINIRQQKSIMAAMSGKWISSMMKLPNDQLLVNSVWEGWYIWDPKTQISTPFIGPSCNITPSPFDIGMKQQIHQDEQGNLWFISGRQHLVQYNPIDASCVSFEIGNDYNLFCFVDKNLVVLSKRLNNELLFYDISSQTFREFGAGITTKLPAKIRDFLVDSRGILWIATNRGLWKLDLEKETSEVLFLDGAVGDVRFPSIYEAPDGKIWLGSYFNGLIIFDPITGETNIINKKQGLSNNSVMSIIADDDHYVWAGTEYGITLLSPEGQVLAEIHEADGLSCETFERFDTYKDKEGLLYFSCRNGINIIDPEQFKANLIKPKQTTIYATELSYFDEEKGKNIVRLNQLANSERLSLPADHRYLKINFALSSYIEPHRNRYAYMLEGINQDWTYLGSQHELVLNQLPAGRYRLLIKGADYQNNWTETPLVIPIHAREFFYKQNWFYVLIFLVIALVALFWIWRLRSEKMRLEAEVQSRTEQIQQDKELIEAQAKDLQKLDEVKSRFFTNISHELRTPITLITTPVEQILRKYAKTFSTEVKKSLQTVHNNSRKLLTLVEELLELSRIDAGKQQLNQSPTHLYSFCRQLFSAYESAAHLKEIEYQFQYEVEESLHYLIDKKRLEKIINNLLGNALKFTPNGGKVTFRVNNTRRVSKTRRVLLTLKIKDTGQGIPPEDLPHIFDRYFQTKRESLPKEGGTGIGLALAKELAELMNGKLSVDSQWGHGSTFTLSIPVQVAAPDPSRSTRTDLTPSIVAVPVNTTSADAVSRTSKKKKVLIVEDNPDMQQLIYSLLSDQYDCIIANNGARAWELLEQQSTEVKGLNLILSDVMMPEMDGYELVDHIKKHKKWKMIPIILLTARAATEDKLHGLRLGVDDYLVKPFTPEELLVRMENLIKHYQQRKLFLESNTYEVDIDFAPTPSAEDNWLKTLEHCILDAIDKKIELNVLYLAHEMALSDRQLLRKLKALTGLSVAQYIKEVKLQKARHLLENKAFETISEVAYASGFNTPKYFSKVFEKRFGKLPGDYVQLHS